MFFVGVGSCESSARSLLELGPHLLARPVCAVQLRAHAAHELAELVHERAVLADARDALVHGLAGLVCDAHVEPHALLPPVEGEEGRYA